jgi:hypothetical protein
VFEVCVYIYIYIYWDQYITESAKASQKFSCYYIIEKFSGPIAYERCSVTIKSISKILLDFTLLWNYAMLREGKDFCFSSR